MMPAGTTLARRGHGEVGGIIGKLLLVVLFVMALGVGAALLLGNLDGIVKSAIEEIGTSATGATVSVESVKIGLTDGTGVIQGVTVANPNGFATESAFRLGKIDVELDTSTLTDDVVVVKKVVIAAPEVTYEWSSDGSNVTAIQENVARFVADLKRSAGLDDDAGSGGGGSGDGKAPKAGDAAPSETTDDGTRLIIEKLVIKEGRIGVSASVLKGRTASATLPRIVLRDLGKAEGGLSSGELAGVVMDAMTSRALEAVSGLGISAISEKASGVVDDLKGRAGKAIKDLFGGGDDD